MKRLLVAILAMGALVGSNAMATNSRLAVMGTGDAGMVLGNGNMTGSLFYNDAYNMFYNPAYVNDFGHWATVEKGTIGGAEGGFVTSLGSLNVGAWMNRSTYTTGVGKRPLDLIVGGDMGMKWGVGATWGQNNIGGTGGTSTMDLSLHAGVEVQDFAPFFHVELTSNQSNIGAGLRYHMNDWTPYAAWEKADAHGAAAKSNNLALGIGHSSKVTEGTMLFYQTGYVKSMSGNRDIVPISLSLEGTATSWLTLRGGLTFNLVDTTAGTSNNSATTGRVGGSLTFNHVDVDFAFGTGVDTLATAPNAPAANINGANIGFDSGTLAMVGATYKW
ncbi:MAG TPA: hypothetical protein VL588_07630 [Bdellovibrionota bacterium]|nr:hypothetical protein [Bdellovibrionota bacterium]